jgi:hypothetical protein
LRDSNEKSMWGHVEKLGKGTKANYDHGKRVITFCFNRNPQTSSELLRAERELLIKELRELGYVGRMKYNGEVVVDNVAEEDSTFIFRKLAQTKTIKIVITDSPQEAIFNGADVCLMKVIKPQEILSVIEQQTEKT